MIASSFTDPMLGVDVHFELVPMPAPTPTPIPNPFTGIVFDPVGLAAGLLIGGAMSAVLGAPFQGPVLYWTAFPATNTGTEGKHVPGHIIIPPGTGWAPFPKTPKPVIHPGETPDPPNPVKPEDDAIMIFGSKTVTVMGSNACRLGDIALSCGEPVRLPSTVVLAVPKGAPILIGGPPSLDILAAVLASLRTRFMSDSLHALISRLKPSRFRNVLHRVACFLTGHPVDVASGKVLTEAVDIELPGPLPLKLERIYNSACARRDGILGHGWSHTLEQAVWRERGKVVFLAEDGREIEFDTFDFPNHRVEVGGRVYNPIERLWLHCERAGVWKVEDAVGGVRLFGPVAGRSDGRAMLQRMVSPTGDHQVAFSYDAVGRLARVEDASKRTILLRHDRHGRMTEMHLPQASGDGHYCHRRYQYDANGDLVRVVDAHGNAWSFEYTSHLLVREQDRNGLSFYFQYDGLGEDAWCVRTWGDGGIHDHVLSYDKKNHVTMVTDSKGQTTQYHMNVAGLVVKVVDPLGGETKYEYDPVTLQQTKETDALGRVTVNEYDDRGNPTVLVKPDGATTRFSWDARNRLVAHEDARGGQWAWRYDSVGRLLERRASDGTWTGYQHDAGYLTAVDLGGGRPMRIGYDSQGLIAEIEAPDGARMKRRHDRLGRPVEQHDPGGSRQSRRFDLEGMAVEMRESTGNQRVVVRDAEGNVVRDKDAQHDVTYTYSGLGNIASRTEAGTKLCFEYDTEAKLTAIVHGDDRVYRFKRDERGEVIAQVGFDGARREYVLDAEAQVVELRRASGTTTRYVHDAQGRLVEAEHSDGTREQYSYREDGELLEATNGDATVRFERDALGRVVREHQGEHWVESGYDVRGYRVRMRSSFGAAMDAERNELGDVVGMRYWSTRSATNSSDPVAAHWAARFERDQLGQELERRLPGGIRSRWGRDALGRPLRHELDGDSKFRDVQYEWGADARLRRMVDHLRGRTIELAYDGLGALAQADFGDGRVDVRMPDALGNLFRRSDRRDREYGAAGQLLQVATPQGPRRYRYDDDGNLVEKIEPDGKVWRYEWSAAGTLISVERPDGKVVEYRYDALGRRILKRYDGATTHFVWDRNVLLHEWTVSDEEQEQASPAPPADAPALAGLDDLYAGRPTRGPPPLDLVTWLFEPGSFFPVAKMVGDASYSIVTDYHGVPVGMFDMDGRRVWSAEIDTYGQLHDIETAEGFDAEFCPLRWPGQYEDSETGLYYNRFRYYDPDAGQYISQDPMGVRAGMHPYRYAADPLTTIDPLGLITGPPYVLSELMDAAQNSLDFSTAPDGAVFWSGPRMADAQAWAAANGKTTLEQTPGGRILDGLNLFDPGSGISGAEAAAVWDAASKRFADGASGTINVFSTGAKKMNAWGSLRTWWRVELPALRANPRVSGITRRRKDGGVCGT